MSKRNEIKPDVLLAQYREAYEYLRQHSRFMWQVHSLAVAISAGLIIAAFKATSLELWWVRDLVLAIALAVTVSLLWAMKKHRYFADSEAWTLSRLEDALGTKRVQRTTQIEDDAPKKDNSKPKPEDYWSEQKPEDKRRKLEELLAKKPNGKSPRYSMLVLRTKIDCKLEVFFAKRSADKCLGYSMYALLAIIILCIIFNHVFFKLPAS